MKEMRTNRGILFSSCHHGRYIPKTTFTMANINEVATNLYDALVKVRYPGVATVERTNLETTILDKNDRNGMLHWLLIQSLRSVNSITEEPKADDNTLVQWYTLLGICDSKDALLGYSSIIEQVPTLVRLTSFIMNVLGVNGNAKVISKEAGNVLDYYLNTELDIIPASFKNAAKMTHLEARRYVKKINERVKEHKIAELPKMNTESNLETESVVDGEKKPENSQETSAAIVAKFCETFEDIDQWVKPNSGKSKDLKNISLDDYMKDIDSNLLQLTQTLKNRKEIANTTIPTHVDIEGNPLDQVIQDAVVLLEEFTKLCDHDND